MLQNHRFVSQTFRSNVYALEEVGSSNVWLVDAGYSEDLMHYLADKKNLKGIFLTHVHFDHISGLEQIIGKFPETRVYGHTLAPDYLYDPEKNLSLFHEVPISYSGKIKVLQEGDEILLGEKYKIKTMEVPGHHPTCLAYQVGNCLFTGDAYIPGIKVITHLPEGNKEAAKQAEERIKKKLNDGLTACSGHTLKNKEL